MRKLKKLYDGTNTIEPMGVFEKKCNFDELDESHVPLNAMN